jgi:hypothetical protein
MDALELMTSNSTFGPKRKVFISKTTMVTSVNAGNIGNSVDNDKELRFGKDHADLSNIELEGEARACS